MYINMFVGDYQQMLKVAFDYLVPTMLGLFFIAIIFKGAGFFTIKCLQKFINQLELNVHSLLLKPSQRQDNVGDFHKLSKHLLIKAFDEIYVLKAKLMRRRLDRITSLSDRLFLIKEGSRKIIDETLKHTKYCSDFEHKPDFDEISHYIVKSNPIFN